MSKFLLCLVVVILIGCKAAPRITSTNALERAQIEFREAGYDPAEYETKISYESKLNSWIVSFVPTGGPRVPGDSHLVFVNAKSGESKFARGE
jgi:hypothetical protein